MTIFDKPYKAPYGNRVYIDFPDNTEYKPTLEDLESTLKKAESDLGWMVSPGQGMRSAYHEETIPLRRQIKSLKRQITIKKIANKFGKEK